MTEYIPLIKEGGAILFALYCVQRMQKLETRLEASEAENRRQGKLLERVCAAYEGARRLLSRLARINRKGEQLTEGDLHEMETMPTLPTLLNSPLDAK